jgi:hypothetical protein
MTRNDNKQFGSLTQRVYDFGALVLRNRQMRALEAGAARYPILRELRIAARVELEVLFDAVALEPSWRAERMNNQFLILDGDGVFVAAHGRRKLDYCSATFYIWAEDLARAEAARQCILGKAGSTRITEPMFTVDWCYPSGSGMDCATIEELADDVLLDHAYPEIKGGVASFIARYLDAPESVLVLQGPPGTGKTRLIRAILGELTRRKGEPAQIVYTADARLLQVDDLFVRFVTGADDAFVVEDADHLLKPRADGNVDLHRFLTIADGVVRSQGRKIIFSTNLPNVGDLDDALIRPGRCFARIHVRTLTPAEAQALAEQLAAGDVEKLARASIALAAGDSRKRSVAEVYRAVS